MSPVGSRACSTFLGDRRIFRRATAAAVHHAAIGDGIAGLEADFVGVHTGEFAGIPPTGANLRVPYSVFYDVDDGGIRALRAYMPVSQMIAELEAARSTAS